MTIDDQTRDHGHTRVHVRTGPNAVSRVVHAWTKRGQQLCMQHLCYVCIVHQLLSIEVWRIYPPSLFGRLHEGSCITSWSGAEALAFAVGLGDWLWSARCGRSGNDA